MKFFEKIEDAINAILEKNDMPTIDYGTCAPNKSL